MSFCNKRLDLAQRVSKDLKERLFKMRSEKYEKCYSLGIASTKVQKH